MVLRRKSQTYMTLCLSVKVQVAYLAYRLTSAMFCLSIILFWLSLR